MDFASSFPYSGAVFAQKKNILGRNGEIWELEMRKGNYNIDKSFLSTYRVKAKPTSVGNEF